MTLILPPSGIITVSLIVPDALWYESDEPLAEGVQDLTSTETILGALACVPCARVVGYVAHSTADGMQFTALLAPVGDAPDCSEVIAMLRRLGFTVHVAVEVHGE